MGMAFMLISAFFFGWRRMYDTGCALDNEVVGNYGDFIGGFLGPILGFISVLFMYWTFQSQQTQTDKISETSSQQADLQRFNDLFFNLLDIYHNLLLQHSVSLQKAQKEMFDQFNASENIKRANRSAQRAYTAFYLHNSSVIAPAFRVLYRIMDLIDNSTISETEKMLYAKILRAHLGESELFLLRYNALTDYGTNFIKYLNKYHLLKHLPVMSMLEFKFFKQKMQVQDADALFFNLIFHRTWRRIYNVTVGKEKWPGTDDVEINRTGRNRLYCQFSSKKEMKLILEIKKDIRNMYPEMKPLTKLSDEELTKFLVNFLYEVYDFSNYHQYNADGLSIKGKHHEVDNLAKIEITVKSNSDFRLSPVL
jgi:hypothetical protein